MANLDCRFKEICDKLEQVIGLLTCETECEVEKTFTFSGLDYENGAGFWNSGSFGATVNGTATSTPWTAVLTSKAAGYQAMLDQINNATPGWTVTVVNDVAIPDGGSDLVDFQFDYCGPAGEAAVLTIVRTTGTRDTVQLNANTSTGTFTDENGPISDGRQPVCL